MSDNSNDANSKKRALDDTEGSRGVTSVHSVTAPSLPKQKAQKVAATVFENTDKYKKSIYSPIVWSRILPLLPEAAFMALSGASPRLMAVIRDYFSSCEKPITISPYMEHFFKGKPVSWPGVKIVELIDVISLSVFCDSVASGQLLLPNVSTLIIRSCNIDEVCSQKLASAAACFKLTALQMNGNFISPEGVSGLVAVLERSRLTELHLWGNVIDKSGFTRVALWCEHLKGVESLLVGGHSREDSGGSLLQFALPRLPSLTRLMISDVELDSQALGVCKALETKPELLDLCLANCNFARTGLHFVSRALKALDNLTSLSVIQCDFEENALQELLKNLKGAELKTLEVRGNAVVDTDAAGVMQLAANYPKLTAIDFSENSITSAGAIQMCMSLKGPSSLQLLDLTDNNLDEEAVLFLKKALHDLDHPLTVKTSLCTMRHQGTTDSEFTKPTF